MKSDHYADMYKFEWEQKSQLLSAVNTPILGLTALGSVLATVSVSFPYGSDLSWWFLGFVIAAGGFLIASLCLVLLSLLDVTYKKLPDPVKLRNYYKELIEWHKIKNSPPDAADGDFQDCLDEHLAVATEANSQRNKTRGKYIYIATALVAFSMLPCGVAAGLYVFANARQPEKIYHVSLTQAKEGQASHAHTGTPQPAASSGASQPTKPAP